MFILTLVKDIRKIFSENSGGVALFIYPHLDDVAFTSSGLIQVARENNIKTVSVSIVPSYGSSVRNTKSVISEFDNCASTLGIDDIKILGDVSDDVIDTSNTWLKKIDDIIKKENPFCIVTFAPDGITSHPDHSFSCVKIFDLVKKMGKKSPLLFWRLPDLQEYKYFKPKAHGPYHQSQIVMLKLSNAESLTKIRAIFKLKSKVKGILFKLRVIDWYLLDHDEPYYLCNFEKDCVGISCQK
jgi:LmbE family N-acetylglucosaminyl deacetylase